MNSRCILTVALALALTMLLSSIPQEVDASLDPVRSMYVQSTPYHRKRSYAESLERWNRKNGKYGVLVNRWERYQAEVDELNSRKLGFLIGVIVLSVILALTWCALIFACLRHANNVRSVERLRNARSNSVLTPLAPPQPMSATFAQAPQVVSTPTSPHGHHHSHSHGHSHMAH